MTERDIIDDIDALVDEQLATGPVDDYTVNRFDKCPKCERDWHGIPLTLQVAVMYSLGVYDEAYDAAKDRSPIVCPGSNNDEPMPEFDDELRRLAAHYAAITLQKMGRIPDHVDIADLIADSYGPETREPVRPEWMRHTPGAPRWMNELFDRTWSWVQDIDRGLRGVAPRRVVQVFVGNSGHVPQDPHETFELRTPFNDAGELAPGPGWFPVGAMREDGPPPAAPPRRPQEGDRMVVFANGRTLTGRLHLRDGGTNELYFAAYDPSDEPAETPNPNPSSGRRSRVGMRIDMDAEGPFWEYRL